MFIPVVDENEADGELEAVYASARARFGFVPDAVRVLSIRPEVASAMQQLRSVVLGDASTLGARRANLIGVAVSGMNHCEYCGTAHAGLLVRGGDLEHDDAVNVYRDWTKVDLPESDQAMLRFAEKLTFTPRGGGRVRYRGTSVTRFLRCERVRRCTARGISELSQPDP